MSELTDFQKRVLALIRKGTNNEWAIAHRMYPGFERNVTPRGAQVSAISRSISVLVRKKLVGQGLFSQDGMGRYANYYPL